MGVADNVNIPAFKVFIEGGIPETAAYGTSIPDALGMLVTLHPKEFGLDALIDQETGAYIINHT